MAWCAPSSIIQTSGYWTWQIKNDRSVCVWFGHGEWGVGNLRWKATTTKDPVHLQLHQLTVKDVQKCSWVTETVSTFIWLEFKHSQAHLLAKGCVINRQHPSPVIVHHRQWVLSGCQRRTNVPISQPNKPPWGTGLFVCCVSKGVERRAQEQCINNPPAYLPLTSQTGQLQENQALFLEIKYIKGLVRPLQVVWDSTFSWPPGRTYIPPCSLLCPIWSNWALQSISI